MSNYDPTFWAAITALLQGVKNVPVLRRSQTNRFNWKNQYEAGDLPSVIWVVDVKPSEEEDWSMQGVYYRYPLTILYLRPANLSAAEVTAGTTVEAAIEAKLAAVRAAFLAYSGTAFQLAGVNPTRNISDYAEFNEIMFELQNRFIGGGFDVRPLVGEY